MVPPNFALEEGKLYKQQHISSFSFQKKKKSSLAAASHFAGRPGTQMLETEGEILWLGDEQQG